MFIIYLKNKIKNVFCIKITEVYYNFKIKKILKIYNFFALQKLAKISRQSENIQAPLKIDKNECSYSYALLLKG
jgi:hypothetical protein